MEGSDTESEEIRVEPGSEAGYPKEIDFAKWYPWKKTHSTCRMPVRILRKRTRSILTVLPHSYRSFSFVSNKEYLELEVPRKFHVPKQYLVGGHNIRPDFRDGEYIEVYWKDHYGATAAWWKAIVRELSDWSVYVEYCFKPPGFPTHNWVSKMDCRKFFE